MQYMESTRFSVVITAYNVGEDLRRCLDSLLHQPYEDYEIVLVNNGSTDKKTIEICEEYSKSSKVHFYSKEYGECIDGRKKGITEAKGKYVVFCDADDFVSPNYMEVLHEATENKAEYYILTNYLNYFQTDNFYEEKSVFQQGELKMEDVYTHILNYEINPVWNKVYLREYFNPVFDVLPESITSTDDLYINLRYLRKAKSAYCLPKGGYYHYCDSISSATSKRIKIYRLREIEVLFNEGMKFSEEMNLQQEQQKFSDKIYGLYLRTITYLLKNGTSKKEIVNYVKDFNIEKRSKVLKAESMKGIAYRFLLNYKLYGIAVVLCK
jgi:glycosyltransferase involved in cell wall biosynthesis